MTRAEIERMKAAAAVVADCRRELAARDTGILAEVVPAGAVMSEWQHYPDGEVYDPASHAQFFYHAHPSKERPAAEHGHFHTFLRAEGMPIGTAPLVLPEIALAAVPAPPPQGAPLKRGVREEVSHLVAIAVDRRGEPFRLFTTNRWVTGETWYRADDVIGMLERFTIAEAHPSALLNRWVGAMIWLFSPQIAVLLRQRDEKVMAWRRLRRRANVLEDPRLEVTSSIEINLDDQLALLDQALSDLAASARSRVPALPPMADGWGEGHAG